MEIIIKGIAGEVTAERLCNRWDDEEESCEPIVLIGANRMEACLAECQDCFSEYIDDITLRNVISGGYMEFTYEKDELLVVVSYEANRKLSEKEKKYLIDYTSGQLSDGVGEGFKQMPFHNDAVYEYYVSPWHFGQKLTLIEK